MRRKVLQSIWRIVLVRHPASTDSSTCPRNKKAQRQGPSRRADEAFLTADRRYKFKDSLQGKCAIENGRRDREAVSSTRKDVRRLRTTAHCQACLFNTAFDMSCKTGAMSLNQTRLPSNASGRRQGPPAKGARSPGSFAKVSARQ